MKRKIAVFTNGWNDDYLEFALEGIRRRANEDKIDIFIFMEYTSYDNNEKDKIGELNILNLPDLKDFDGVLLLGNTLNTANENVILREKILQTKVPSLCLEYQLEDINCIRTENYNGMKELMEHMINIHNVKDVFYISGPSDNAESNERYQAVVDTMEKYGLKMNPDNVFDGCWSYAIVEENIPKIVKSLDKLPDVFICANDSMALATCIALEKIGISVPQDVRVTGFDNLMSGNYFSPMLTSVDRGWNERSYQAMDSLINLINGSPDFGDKLYDSKFDLGESCGCSMGDEGKKIQKKARMRAFSIPVERTIFDWHLIGIDDAVSKVKTVDDIHKGFSKLWESSHNYEGNEFYICLDQNFVDSMVKDVDSKSEGYSDSLDVIYGMKDGQTIDRTSISLKELVPNHNPDSSESEMYLFIPLHSGAECLGYYVCKNHISTIKDFYLNSLTRHISSGLERARQNIQLENLNKILEDMSVRDELTGLYNRMGYEKIVIPYLNDLRSSKKKSIIMVADINRMKVINDEFGHLQGDAAIRIIAYVLKSTVPANWKTVRYGGDEYVMIGECDNEKDVEVVKNEIINKAKNMAKELALPFKLSVSVGYVIVDTEDKVGNEEYFRMADEAMYEMKQKAHREA